MKFLPALFLTLITAAGLAACATHDTAPQSPVDIAEEAFAAHRYAKAQQIVDTITLGSAADYMSVDELCRVSLLFMRLAEVQPDIDEANIANAARAYTAAVARDSDSAVIVMSNVDIDDRGRAALVRAIAAAQHPDSLAFDTVYPDTIP